MGNRKRHQRKGHERSAPNRLRSNLRRQPDSSDGSAMSQAARVERIDDAVAHGVELGYQVIDQYIRQGQTAAERLNKRNYENGRGCNSETAAEDLQELVERVVRLSTSLIPQRTEGALAWGRDFLRGLLNQWASHPPGDGTSRGDLWPDRTEHGRPRAGGVAKDRASANDTRPVSVEVVSSRPARVTLDVRPHHGGLTLRGGGMRAIDSKAPPLRDVTFIAGDEADCSTFCIRVAEDQPAGTYTGVVADAQSGEPCGTLSVRIAAG